tara:strand:- start:2351 stop:3394 length:1044 start_codon:yes stop_codon:yes gene_type:complete
MTALEPVLMDAARPDASGASGNSSGGGTGGGTGGAMATAGNDDRLYVFEAFGLLLGIEDVPDDVRVRYLEAVFNQLRTAVETACQVRVSFNACVGDYIDGVFFSQVQNQDPAAAQHAVVAMGNVAKGFTSRIATTTSPRVGEILGSGLDPALRCVQLWPRDGLTRQRVVAYFQRLVTTTGARVFPYVSPLVEHMRHGASAVELRECLVLINQLMASFKEQLAPFMAAQLPAICSQIAVALTPFAAPGGGVNGVCGLYLDGAHRVNPAFGGNQGQGGGGVSGGVNVNVNVDAAALKAGSNTEEAREARDLEKLFVAHAHGKFHFLFRNVMGNWTDVVFCFLQASRLII